MDLIGKLTMKLPVARSAPVNTIATRPKGKIMAASSFITPGAFSWYQGEVLTMETAAQAKARMAPAMKLLRKILSMRIRALAAPAREEISTASWGE